MVMSYQASASTTDKGTELDLTTSVCSNSDSEIDFEYLFDAVKYKEVLFLEKTLQRGDINVNEVISSKRSMNNLLIAAVYSNSVEIVDLLLRVGIDVNFTNLDSRTAIDVALEHKSCAIVVKLLNSDAFVLTTDVIPILFLLCSYGDPQSIQKIIDFGADVNATRTFKYDEETPLMIAVNYNNTLAAAVLVKNGAKVNNELKDAIYHRNIAMLQLLVGAGADVKFDVVNSTAASAWSVAYYSYYDDIVEYLENIAHSNFDKKLLGIKTWGERENKFASTDVILDDAIFEVVEQGRLDVLRTSVEAGLDVSILSEEVESLLMIATRCKDVRIVRYLIESEVDINYCTNNQLVRGNSALSLAVDQSSFDIVQVLLRAGCQLQDSNGTKLECVRRLDDSAYEGNLLVQKELSWRRKKSWLIFLYSYEFESSIDSTTPTAHSGSATIGIIEKVIRSIDIAKIVCSYIPSTLTGAKAGYFNAEDSDSDSDSVDRGESGSISDIYSSIDGSD